MPYPLSKDGDPLDLLGFISSYPVVVGSVIQSCPVGVYGDEHGIDAKNYCSSAYKTF
ncbi:inorganic diphosphatase [uncultured Acinetobacter sp.]|uniref:inorganic diphosphatase n=1 Tax=uncultured Acinetobacter sp. TaxID=165433 RepID=UPI0025FEA8CA|nr:inorganic diphosphatase [uncultured Acinetobacter sp.]